MHGADHAWYYHKSPWNSVPWRIRNKAPESATGDRWIRAKANRRFDKWKVTYVADFVRRCVCVCDIYACVCVCVRFVPSTSVVYVCAYMFVRLFSCLSLVGASLKSPVCACAQHSQSTLFHSVAHFFVVVLTSLVAVLPDSGGHFLHWAKQLPGRCPLRRLGERAAHIP
jgi:hypothetical protein